MIELQGVKKLYDKRLVLDVPALAFEPGQRYALIGPNGSGKSTLLRILAGTVKPDAGTVLLADVDSDGRAQPLPWSEIAYLPQTPYAFDLTVLQNVMLPLERGGAARAQAMAALERVGLAQLAHARGNRLSGGEMQRMALARVLVKPHRLLLLDEPTSAADMQAGHRIERVLLEFCADQGCTLVFATHAPSQALRLATRVVSLAAGRIVETGEAAAVLRSPQSEETRALLHHWRL